VTQHGGIKVVFEALKLGLGAVWALTCLPSEGSGIAMLSVNGEVYAITAPRGASLAYQSSEDCAVLRWAKRAGTLQAHH
jgi:hypothetical protein